MKSFAISVLVLVVFGSFASLAQTKTDKDSDTKTAAAKPSKKDAKKDEKNESNCKGGGQECPPHTRSVRRFSRREG
jgi:hypothetical protein